MPINFNNANTISARTIQMVRQNAPETRALKLHHSIRGRDESRSAWLTDCTLVPANRNLTHFSDFIRFVFSPKVRYAS